MFKKIKNLIRYFIKVKFSKRIYSNGLVKIGKNVKLIAEDNGIIQLGKNVVIKDFSVIYAKKNAEIVIGNNTSTGCHTEVSANKSVVIGDKVIMGAYTYITDSNHGYSIKGMPFKEQPMDVGNVIIGSNIWLGRNSFILKGSNLGDDTIVAAGAIVTKSFKGNVILGGIPAKKIKSIYE